MNKNFRNKDRGFALISAMVVLAIVTGATVAMVAKQTNGIELTTNIIRYNQISNHGDGIFLWAEGVLLDDIKSNVTDSLQDNWNQPLVGVEIEGGKIDATIIDLQSKFNINNLGLDGDSGELARERFRRLLFLLNITTDFTDAVADWIDADTQTRFPNGAEDEYYLSLEDASYRTANESFSSINELLLVKGVSLLSFEKLQPYISALDVGVGININTAPEIILLSLSDQMDRSGVSEIKTIVDEGAITELADPSSSGGDVTAQDQETITDTRELEENLEHELKVACRIDKLGTREAFESCRKEFLNDRNRSSSFNNNAEVPKYLPAEEITNKYNLNLDGITVSSSYFGLSGKVSSYGTESFISYKLSRDSTNGQVQLIFKKISGLNL